MIQINRITKLKDCGTFRDFSWPSNLMPLSKYNLIYGWNGTGKTTLSSVLRDLERRENPSKYKVQIEIGGNQVNGDDFSTLSEPKIRVFNRDFIKEQVFPENKYIPGVFVLGKANIEDQSKLEKTRIDNNKISTILPSLKVKAQRAKEAYEKFCTAQAFAIKSALQVSQVDPYKNYNISHYKNSIKKLSESSSMIMSPISSKRVQELQKIITQQPLDSIPLLSEWSFSAMEHLNEVETILAEPVRASIIAELKQDVRLARWTEEGLSLHKENDQGLCKFCEQQLPLSRLKMLEDHFNESVAKLKDKVSRKIQELELLKSTFGRKLPHKRDFYQQFQQPYEIASEGFMESQRKLESESNVLIQFLKQKLENPFEVIELKAEISALDNSFVVSINELIGQHNKETSQLTSTKKVSCEEYELNAVANSFEEYKERKGDMENAQKIFEEAQVKHERLSVLESSLQQSLRQHRTPAEELNKDIRDYLGHDEITLQVHETGYQIMRGKILAEDLSEGERTAIAILYFLKSLDDSSFDLSSGIVVLDDPVSSLDENALFNAFGFIKRKTSEAGQLILLTHNFTFFRQVKTWFKKDDGRKGQLHVNSKARLYMTRCGISSAGRVSSLGTLDPLLSNYESDYQYLFSLIYSHAQNKPESLADSYHLPNVARRLLESFLGFRSPNLSGEFQKRMDAIDFDETKKERIIRFCHNFFHSQMVPSPDHDPHILVETSEVLCDVLSLIEKEDPRHYAGLQSMCEATLAS
jgi:wobble nucleotide-excising tRNase